MFRKPQQVILTFHGIGTPPVAVPEAERPYWIGERDFRDLLERLSRQAPAMRLRLLLTFDDGNKSDLEIAAPILKAHGLDGLFFPCTGRLERPGYLNAGDLRRLDAQGFEIGSHGVAHLPWATLGGEDLDAEINGSKADIERILARPVRMAALPFGSYNRAVLSALRRAGYERIYSSDPGFAAPGSRFQYRFSWREGADFDLDRLIRRYAKLQRRFTRAARTVVKSLR